MIVGSVVPTLLGRAKLRRREDLRAVRLRAVSDAKHGALFAPYRARFREYLTFPK